MTFTQEQIDNSIKLKAEGLDWTPKEGDYCYRKADGKVIKVGRDWNYPIDKYFDSDGTVHHIKPMSYQENNLVWLQKKIN